MTLTDTYIFTLVGMTETLYFYCKEISAMLKYNRVIKQAK